LVPLSRLAETCSGDQPAALKDQSQILKTSGSLRGRPDFNSARPHQALGNRTPMALWRQGITGNRRRRCAASPVRGKSGRSRWVASNLGIRGSRVASPCMRRSGSRTILFSAAR
jgi:hypothetical protein